MTKKHHNLFRDWMRVVLPMAYLLLGCGAGWAAQAASSPPPADFSADFNGNAHAVLDGKPIEPTVARSLKYAPGIRGKAVHIGIGKQAPNGKTAYREAGPNDMDRFSYVLNFPKLDYMDYTGQDTLAYAFERYSGSFDPAPSQVSFTKFLVPGWQRLLLDMFEHRGKRLWAVANIYSPAAIANQPEKWAQWVSDGVLDLTYGVPPGADPTGRIADAIVVKSLSVKK